MNKGMKDIFICLHPADNVLVCIRPLKKNQKVEIEGEILDLQFDLNVGHKVCMIPIAKDQKIIKHGVSIGSALININKGEHVHTHNMKSNYIEAHRR